ncbi:MAG: hypothetical protein HYW63_01295 [Candidatus Levybacteria bacterium]|nr:hypothetical protein [Candidatus Levybacteria bacterium]
MKKKIFLLQGIFILLISIVFLGARNTSAQNTACPAVVLQGGRVTLATDLKSEGTYRVWSRMKAGNTTGSNAFHIQIDDNCPVKVGGSGNISSNDWTWVDYQNADTSSKIDVNLTSGNHVITLIGGSEARTYPGVSVDKLLLTQDPTCVPADFGDNCPADSTVTPSPEPNVTLTPAPSSQVSAFIESNGRVVMEAESHDRNISRTHDGTEQRWQNDTTLDNFSGDRAKKALPNVGSVALLNSSGVPSNSPEMIYNINFTQAGTYYIWTRSSGVDADTNSIHAGLDAVTQTNSSNLRTYFRGYQGLNTIWRWYSEKSQDSATRASITIDTAGIHTFHIWMREDGAVVDKIVLTKDAAWQPPTPSDKGPVESQRGLFGGASPTPLPGTATVLNFSSVKLHGIGSGGASSNPTLQGNPNPITPVKSLVAEIYDSEGSLVTSGQGNIVFSKTTGDFSGKVILDPNVPFVSGDYLVKIKTDKFLKRQLGGIITINSGSENNMPQVALIAGDSNGDGLLSVLDWNVLLDCFSDLEPAKNCADPAKKSSADISDDGNVNQDDLTTFLAEISVVLGD